ncbi:hypothetical protein D3C86_902660 [compost metagenome]
MTISICYYENVIVLKTLYYLLFNEAITNRYHNLNPDFLPDFLKIYKTLILTIT